MLGSWSRSPTLAPDVRPSEVLDRIDYSIGCSIKDSFATLDLSGFGLEVLFEASWFSCALDQTGPAASGWHSVRTDPEFAEWERAWRGETGPKGVFVPGLMSDDRVTVGQLRSGERLLAGAIFTALDGVVGITNFFTVPGSGADAWSTCIAFASERFCGSNLVGYASGPELATLLDSGFINGGPLRVWEARGARRTADRRPYDAGASS